MAMSEVMATGAQAGIVVEAILAESGRMEQESAAASSSASSVAMNVRMVHGMMGEMMRGIAEVDTHVMESQRKIEQAAAESARASERVSELSRAVSEIATTANLIDQIARATNMLALNATIEAARAGELGRGFAVVAAEVKSLARQTAQATEGVHHQLETIRHANGEVLAAVGTLNQDLSGIQAQVKAVASAVTEQNSSLKTVSECAKEAADTVETIAATLDRIAATSRSTCQRMRQFDGIAVI
jgi:methyl-accepting chemotaxis protein